MKRLTMAVAGGSVLAFVSCDVNQTASVPQTDMTRPEAVAEAAMRALIKGDANAWVGFFRDGQYSAEVGSFVKKGAEDARENGVEFVSVGVDERMGDKATVVVTTKSKVGWEGKKTMRLVKVGREWRIE